MCIRDRYSCVGLVQKKVCYVTNTVANPNILLLFLTAQYISFGLCLIPLLYFYLKVFVIENKSYETIDNYSVVLKTDAQYVSQIPPCKRPNSNPLLVLLFERVCVPGPTPSESEQNII